jgi:broad specificity phosphatase PhoE
VKVEKIVYFVRHAESEHNVAPVFQSPDSPLSARGARQAEMIAGRVSRLAFDALIASPFRRAKETAEAIAKLTRKQPEFSDLFVERVKPSSLNGKPYDDAQARAIWKEWSESLSTPGLRVRDGENFDDLVARADKALAFLDARPEPSLVVVTHGYFLRVVIARVLLGDLLTSEIFRRFQKSATVENTGLTALRYHGAFEEPPRWRLWIYNDHAHLG